MHFVVRQISKTADGREIIRATTLDQGEVLIGRDSTNAIHLADLAVDMQHARLSLTTSGKVLAEAVGTLGFDLDGRTVMRAEIAPAVGGELRFGSHRLTLSQDGEAAVISVERVGSVSDSTVDRDDSKLFTLKGLLPGRRMMAWALLAAVLALFLAWPISSYLESRGVKDRPAGFHADTMWTSGALSQSHRSLEKNCQACHVNKFEAVTDTACLACHKADAHDHAPAARLINARGAPDLEGKVKLWFKDKAAIPQGRCVECHSEHEGAGKMPPTAQAFCADCHASLNQRLRDTRLPNASDFGKDHPQFMPALTVNPGQSPRIARRIAMDKPLVEGNGLHFPHNIHLSKTNGIARMAQTMAGEQGWGNSLECKTCHVATADGVRFQPITMERNCGMCHSLAFDKIGGTIRTLRHGEPAQVIADLRAFYRSTLPARPINLGGMARRVPGQYAAIEIAQDYMLGARQWPGSADRAIDAVFSKGGACYDCHVVTRTAGGYGVMGVTQPARYLQHGWFDHNAHKTETCQSCHKAETSGKASDLLLPDLASCRTCHVGEGGARLKAVEKPVKSGCAMCHDYHIGTAAPWKPDDDRKKATQKVSAGP